jgi:hypothetical protein
MGKSYYDTFLKRYQDRAKEKGWRYPLMGIDHNQINSTERFQ